MVASLHHFYMQARQHSVTDMWITTPHDSPVYLHKVTCLSKQYTQWKSYQIPRIGYFQRRNTNNTLSFKEGSFHREICWPNRPRWAYCSSRFCLTLLWFAFGVCFTSSLLHARKTTSCPWLVDYNASRQPSVLTQSHLLISNTLVKKLPNSKDKLLSEMQP